MKSMFIKNILVIVICGILIVSMGNIDRLPWWIFLLPVMIVGYGLTLLKWDLNAFMVGFISGFLIWFFGNLLFDVQYDGFIIAKMAFPILNLNLLILYFSESDTATSMSSSVYFPIMLCSSSRLLFKAGS